MICCLNPDCENPLNPDGRNHCENCHSNLIPLLRGHYRVIDRLSDEGGFSITYLAEDIDKLNERCVVKQFAPKVKETSALNKAIELFKQEAERLQKLGEHKQIPTLLAYFEQENYLFLVQQFIEGPNLLQELQQEGEYSESKVREFLLDLLPILCFIHQHGVIHRDIKPQNIIRRQDDGKLVLIDFGASKQLTATVHTKIGTSIGSHGYIAMEQMQRGEASPASDLFSLGATCFHLLSGIPTYKLWMEHGYAWVELWRKYLNTPNVAKVPPQLKLGKILDKLLTKDVRQRYQSADEVINDLKHQSILFQQVPTTQIKFDGIVSRNHSGAIASTSLIPNFSKKEKKHLITSGAIIILALISVWYFQVKYPVNTETSENQPVNKVPEKFEFPVTLKGHASDVNSVVFSQDGQKLFTGSDDNTIKAWNLNNKQEILTFRGHSGWIWAIALSPNNKILASSGADKTIKLWNPQTGKEIRTLSSHSMGVTSLAFSPDNQILASAGADKTIKLWNLQNGQAIRTFRGHLQTVASIAYSPDGKILASGSWDKTIKLWNSSTGQVIRTFKGHSDIIISIAFSPDGKTIASASKDNTIKLWNTDTGKEIRTLKGHTDKVNSVAFILNNSSNKSLRNTVIVSGSNDNTLKLWNPTTGDIIRTLKEDPGYVYSIAISPDGKVIASGGSAENIIKIWQIPINLE
ncbi:MAG: serine/threonine-protein kinase [Cyanobacteria bacterium P01_A01_bin.84]